MKLAVVTIYDSIINYGSFLQAYALEQVLKQMGHEVYFVRRMEDKEICNRFEPVKSRINSNHISLYKKIIFEIKNIMFIQQKQKFNKKRFDCFQKDWKKLSIINKDQIKEKGIEAIICGSDEIWNLHNKDIDLSFYGCEWAYHVPKLAYAISSGDTKINEFQNNDKFYACFGDFNKILPRDEQTQNVMAALTGRKEALVCDPTILLGKNAYKIKDFYQFKGRYMLIYSYYFTPMEKKYIKRYARKNNLKIISACIPIAFADKTILTSSTEFPSLIANAECVVTSTFHGTIFSLMFAKRMCCIPKFHKTEELLKRTKTEYISFPRDGSYELFEKKLNIDIRRKEVESIFNEMKNFSEATLKVSLEEISKKGYSPLGVHNKN